eukprot:5549643-Prymnesium_polylepis.1
MARESTIGCCGGGAAVVAAVVAVAVGGVAAAAPSTLTLRATPDLRAFTKTLWRTDTSGLEGLLPEDFGGGVAQALRRVVCRGPEDSLARPGAKK